MPGLSNWREEFNLSEVVTGKMTDKEALKKVSEKSGINNKVTINPKLDEAVKEIGGEVVSMVEADTTAQKQRLDMKQMILDRQKLKLRRKDMSAAKQEKKQGVDGDATNASKQANVIAQEEVVTERLGGKGYKPYTSLTGKKVSGDWEDSDRGAGNKAKKRAGGKVEKKSPTYRAYVLNKEGYEEKKTSEVLAAFKRDPKVRKRFEKAAKKEDGPGSVKNRAADSMLQTAKDTAKRKGDTSKSDDRYAYEEVVHEATRYKKEKGYDRGGTKKPSGKKDAALSAVVSMIRSKHGKGAIAGQGSRQQKKVKGAKSTAGTGKYKRAADEKKQLKKDAKEMGYGSDTKGYIETRARYGSKENMKSGRGLGT